MTYAYLILADHEMYAVEPGWRFLAINTVNGGAYEIDGGFTSFELAVTCRDGFIARGCTPNEAPGEFGRLSADAVIVGEPAGGQMTTETRPELTTMAIECPLDGGLEVQPFVRDASHGFELYDPDTGDVAAVIYDGADRDAGVARGTAVVLAAAPVMLRLLSEALAIKREEFEEDLDVNGGDLVEEFAIWRDKVLVALQLVPAPNTPAAS